MAWWNQPEGSVTPTVTLRRLAAWLAVRGYRYDLDLSEGVVHFSVAGFDYVLMVVDRRILAVRAHHRLTATRPGSAELSRVRAVAQEVSSGRLIPAFYTEVDAAGLSLCAEVLTNIGAGLDDAQLAGTLDFILDGVDQALREVLGLLAAQDAAVDIRPDAGTEAESVPAPRAESGPETVGEVATEGEGGGATVIALPEEPRPDRAAGTADTAEVAGGESTRDSVQSSVAATTRSAAAGTAAGMADATVEMVAVVDGPVPGASGDAEGGTGAETTDTPKPLLVS
ncbi:hypothetical protein BKH17_09220 [Actinomyces oris]|uniref:hypothetical protein n=1 Tax=Actinomyces TaxID=1654 RepID=UPI000949EEA0|nr:MULTISPECIES: hypothetical protein [Actinomyces]OLL11808.1 hypothetical protein BKH17_09220 [Actinomyces oris]QLF54438.1 hypothetical protein HW274_12145 [Actinomyces sp. oral taxon 169]